MKKISFIIILVLCALIVSSCGDNTTPNEGPKTIEVVPDSIKEHLVKQDSLYAGLIAKIDTLTSELNKSQSTIVKLQQNIDDLKSPSGTWGIVSIMALLFAVITFWWSFRNKGIGENDVKSVINNYLHHDNKINELSMKVQQHLDGQVKKTNYTGSVSGKLEERISSLERRINQVTSGITQNRNQITESCPPYSSPHPISPKESQPHIESEKELSKNGYAKLNSEKYFLDILDSNQEGCVFRIKFKNSNRGEFDLISLDKIKSRNGWQEVVEITGNSTMEDATDYTLLEEGICEILDDGKTWEVKKKLKIKVSK